MLKWNSQRVSEGNRRKAQERIKDGQKERVKKGKAGEMNPILK